MSSGAASTSKPGTDYVYPTGSELLRTLRNGSNQKKSSMRQTLLSLAMPVAVSISLPAREQPSIKRLDGSTITSAEVDETVSRLMKAADVTGVGIAIFNDGKVAYLNADGFRDKDQNLPLTVDSVMSAAYGVFKTLPRNQQDASQGAHFKVRPYRIPTQSIV
jgi:hypothetical protein